MSHVNYNDNNLAVVYARYSNEHQNDASIPQQLSAAAETAEALGLTIVREYYDAAMSGTTAARPQYQRMLSELPILKPSTLLLWKNDRLGRDRYELARAKEAIESAGVRLYLIKEGGYLQDGSSGVLQNAMLDGFSAWYSAQLSENVRRGNRWNAEHGLGLGHAPLGYRRGDDKKYVLDEKYAPIIASIFAEYASGTGLQDICDTLNGRGIPSAKGGTFTINTLRAILKNDKYTGIYREAGVEIVGGMPAIVSQDTFDRVQRRFAENKRKGGKLAHGEDKNSDFWLTGKLFCGHCKKPMRGVSGTSKTKGRRYRYYECAGRKPKKQKDGKRPPKCSKHNERKDDLEALILSILEDILSSQENLTTIAVDAAAYYSKTYGSDSGYIDGLRLQYADTETALRNVMRAIEKGVITETTERRLVELEEQRATLDRALTLEEMKAELLQDDASISAYFERFMSADLQNPATRDYVLDYFIDAIYVYDDDGGRTIDLIGKFYDFQSSTFSVTRYTDEHSGFTRLAYSPASTRSYELAFYQGFFIIRARIL